MGDVIVVSAAFAARARAHLTATGEPLLEYTRAAYLVTLYACTWQSPEYVIQADEGPAIMPYTT
jgi:hypothetical protein